MAGGGQWRSLLRSVLRIAVAVYIGLCLLVFLRQSSYVYYPDQHLVATPETIRLAFEDVRLRTQDGETLSAWWLPVEQPQGSILFSHGNAGDMADRLGSLYTFHGMGFNVLIYDYRGYGKSTGKPSEQGTYRDVRAAWDYLVHERGIDPGRIVLFGRSLGGAVSARLATQMRPGALVLDSAFSSAADMAGRMFPFLPVRWLLRFDYDTRAALQEVDCPVAVLHSPEDTLVPYEQGRALYRAAPAPKLFIRLEGGHNTGGLDGSHEARNALRAFLTAHLPSETAKDLAGRRHEFLRRP